MAKLDLEKYRLEIDRIDRELLDLLNQRFVVARNIGEVKTQAGLNLFDPGREMALLTKLKKLNPGEVSDDALEFIYREIMSASLASQAPISVGYLGPESSFSHEAALSEFGRSANLMAMDDFAEVFRGVDRGRTDYGVVPVENSNQGGVSQTLDLFLDYELFICQEFRIRINHNLMAQNDSLDEIKKVYSHPQVLSQCSRWLEKNLPDVPQFELSSSSAAAKKASKEDGTAAIAGKVAANLFELNVLAKAIEDAEQNVTRFLVLSRKPARRTGMDKTSLVILINDRPGALLGCLQPFADRGINMTKIESRPKKGEAWRYIFFIDIEGHMDDEVVKETIEEAGQFSQWIKILGSYPRAD
jgi:chorismate mutase/prephenate dehydratase